MKKQQLKIAETQNEISQLFENAKKLALLQVYLSDLANDLSGEHQETLDAFAADLAEIRRDIFDLTSDLYRREEEARRKAEVA